MPERPTHQLRSATAYTVLITTLKGVPHLPVYHEQDTQVTAADTKLWLHGHHLAEGLRKEAKRRQHTISTAG